MIEGVINMQLSLILYSISAIIIISIILILLALKKDIKILKTSLIIIAPIMLFLVCYLGNHNFNVFIKSKLFSQQTHTVIYSGSKKMDIPLPPNSVWLFKTPTDVYYSKYNADKCKDFFHSVLMDMNHNHKIKNYFYDSNENAFIIEVEGEANVKIDLIGDSDNRRYGISDPKY